MTGGDAGTLEWDLTPYIDWMVGLWRHHPVLVYLAGYLLWCQFIYRIGRRAGVEHPIRAFFPILQGLVLAEAGGRSFVWGLLLPLPGFGHVGSAVIGMGIAEQRDQPRWLGALCAVPGVHMVILGYFAYRDPPMPEDLPHWAEARDPLGRNFRSPVPTGLPQGRALCRRCGLVYDTCDREWSAAGCCSRACLGWLARAPEGVTASGS